MAVFEGKWRAARGTVLLAALGAVHLGAALGGGAAAAENCAICSQAIVTNSGLATCFLERFPDLAKEGGAAVAVDLSDCPVDRGIVEALPTPGMTGDEKPDTEFFVTRTQLSCLKAKLEEPGLVLDPQARIDLGGCG